MLALFFIIFFLAAIVLLLFVNFKIEIKTVDNRKRNFICLRLFFGSIPIYKITFAFRLKNYVNPQIYVTNKKYMFQKIMTGRKLLKSRRKPNARFSKKLFRIMRAFRWKRINLRISLGTGEAASTALICGSIQMLFNSIFSVYQKKIEEHSIILYPQFNTIIFHMRLDCIIKIKLANIIREYLSK